MIEVRTIRNTAASSYKSTVKIVCFRKTSVLYRIFIVFKTGKAKCFSFIYMTAKNYRG